MKHKLDDAARINLNRVHLIEYEQYRDHLMSSGKYDASEIYTILSGLIWNLSDKEEYELYVKEKWNVDEMKE